MATDKTLQFDRQKLKLIVVTLVALIIVGTIYYYLRQASADTARCNPIHFSWHVDAEKQDYELLDTTPGTRNTPNTGCSNLDDENPTVLVKAVDRTNGQPILQKKISTKIWHHFDAADGTGGVDLATSLWIRANLNWPATVNPQRAVFTFTRLHDTVVLAKPSVTVPTPGASTAPTLPATISQFNLNPSNIAGSGQITLKWSAKNILSAEIDNGIGALNVANGQSSGAKTITINETTSFTLSAVGLDNKTKTETITATVTKPTLATPTLSARAKTSTAVSLNWTTKVQPDSITLIRTQKDSTNEPKGLVVSNGATTYTDTGLTPRQTYSYQLMIRKGEVESDWSDLKTVTLSLGQTTQLKEPTNFTARNSNGEVAFTWKDNADNELGYRIYYKNTALQEDFKRLVSLPENSKQAWRNLGPGTYQFYVEAYGIVSGAEATSPASPTKAVTVR